MAVWLISGVPGAGKTTVAHALCLRYPHAIHIPVEELRNSVVSGRAEFLGDLTDEARTQYRLAARSASTIAAIYADYGFTVVIDDLVPQELVALYEPFLGAVRKVLLAPTLEVALGRNSRRTDKADPASLARTIRRFHPALLANTGGWSVIDTSTLSVDRTVDAILAQAS